MSKYEVYFCVDLPSVDEDGDATLHAGVEVWNHPKGIADSWVEDFEVEHYGDLVGLMNVVFRETIERGYTFETDRDTAWNWSEGHESFTRLATKDNPIPTSDVDEITIGGVKFRRVDA